MTINTVKMVLRLIEGAANEESLQFVENNVIPNTKLSEGELDTIDYMLKAKREGRIVYPPDYEKYPEWSV